RLREGSEVAGGATLAELRARAGLTQEQVSERMGISQSDVSKLERRSDLKLTTLRAYISALEGNLQVTVRLPGDAAAERVRLPGPIARSARAGRPERT
ncbi:MAG: helix-turn-helix domain-containing protein, partial [Actinomycetota bacterium]